MRGEIETLGGQLDLSICDAAGALPFLTNDQDYRNTSHYALPVVRTPPWNCRRRLGRDGSVVVPTPEQLGALVPTSWKLGIGLGKSRVVGAHG